MIVGTFRKACACSADARPGHIYLANLRLALVVDTALMQQVDMPQMDLVLDPVPSCDACQRDWDLVKE